MAPNKVDDSIEREVKAKKPKRSSIPTKKEANRGAWTTEEDKKLAEAIEVHGAKRWKVVAAKAGLNRCGKSCRLRWLNYLRPNIKRGNISDQEEDLILRLHKLLGNRWSLIAGRLPGRTDNEIKNYWNSHLSKKVNNNYHKENPVAAAAAGPSSTSTSEGSSKSDDKGEASVKVRDIESTISNNNITISNNIEGHDQDSCTNFNVDDFFDFSNEDSLNLKWMSQFLELDKGRLDDMS